MPEPLERTLERTGFRASLAPEYTAGRAPEAQRRDGQVTPERPTYYDLPAIKKPEWLWFVPAYFFVGGVSAGAYIVATLADLIGRDDDRPVVRAGRYLALVGMLLSPVLLIADLGRPERFLNMLRVFKPRSVMNLGTWGLTTFGLFTGVGAAAQLLQDLGGRSRLLRLAALPLRVLSWLGLLPAIFVGSYTGALLSATSVPLWAGNRGLMGPLFLSSALSTGLAAVSLAARLFGRLSPETDARLKRAESVALTAELGLSLASGLKLRGLLRPLFAGRWGRLYQIAGFGTGMLLPIALQRTGRNGRAPLLRSAGVISSVLVLIGGVATRFAWVEGGKQSADDPRSYFEYTRPGRWQ